MQKGERSPDIHYSMHIAWSPEDNVYIVSVPELPGARTHGATYEEAAAMGQEVIEMYLDVLHNTGRAAPSPRYFCVADESEARASG